MTDALDADDREALRDLAARYALAADTRTFDRMRDVFTAEAVLDTGRATRTGIEEILSAMEGLRRYTATQHLVGQQVVDPRPDGAEGVTHCTAHHLSSDGDAFTDTVMHIRYHDRFARTDDGWRIARRRLDVVWTDVRPVG